MTWRVKSEPLYFVEGRLDGEYVSGLVPASDRKAAIRRVKRQLGIKRGPNGPRFVLTEVARTS